MTKGQRAMVAARLANTDGKGRPSKNAQICAITQDDAAKMLNVSRREVQRSALVIAEACK